MKRIILSILFTIGCMWLGNYIATEILNNSQASHSLMCLIFTPTILFGIYKIILYDGFKNDSFPKLDEFIEKED